MTPTSPDTARPPAPLREPKPRGVLCPFCGEVSPDGKQCRGCRAFLDPLSRQATQNEMGPWFIRDPSHPFRPGCSFDTIRRMVQRGKIGPMTVIRGPATRQTWSFAGRTPAIANLMGLCHNCQRDVSPDAFSCAACGASFAPQTDRQHLGLAPVHLLPGQSPPEAIASAVSPPLPTTPQPQVVVTPNPRLHVGPPTPPRPQPIAAAASPRSTPDAGALRASVSRLRVAAVLLVVLVLGLGAVLAATLAGVPLFDWLGAPPGERTNVKGTAPQPPGEPAPVPAPADMTKTPGTLPGEPAEPATGGRPADNAAPEPVTPPAQGEPAPPPLSLADELMPLLTSDPIDLAAVRSAAAELARRNPTTDASAWLGAAERRAQILTLRAMP